MTLISAYVKNYYIKNCPDAIVKTYDDITPSTIEAFVHNVRHRAIFTSSKTVHVFIKKLLIAKHYTYLYSNFIKSDEFVAVLKAIPLPPNHRIHITYIIEHKPNAEYPIGNEFVVTTTISECNKSISHMLRHIVTWLNRTMTSRCVLRIPSERKIHQLLTTDVSIPERSIDTYLEELIVCKSFVADAMADTLEGKSLYDLFQLYDNMLDVSISEGIRLGTSGEIGPDIVHTLLNFDKIKYVVISMDELLDIGISKEFVHKCMSED